MKIYSLISSALCHFGFDRWIHPQAVLPDEVITLLGKGRAFPLAGYIDLFSSQNNFEELFIALRRRAVCQAWPALELLKLDAYKKYFLRQYQDAFVTVEHYINPDEDGFDADCAGIAMQSLYNSNQYDRAYRYLKRLGGKEKLMLGNVGFLVSSAMICWSAGDRYRSNKYTDLCLARTRDKGTGLFNAVGIYFELGDSKGMALSQEIVGDEDESDPNFRYSKAFMEFAHNRYERGFSLAENRYDLPEIHRYLRKELLERRRWKGENIAGLTLLIHGEQGLGDMIQTARYFPRCLEVAKKVIVECPHESIALLKHNFPEINFVPLHLQNPVSLPYDIWVGTLSLPYVFGENEATIIARSGYITIPEEHAAYWRKRVLEQTVRSSGLKVGLAWSGYPGHRADRRRSLPWHVIKELVEQNGMIDFFALQTAVPDDLPENLHDCSDEMATLCDTAALVGQMDLVITVDTSVVHIAGALGKESWMMLPYRYEWRWSLEGEKNCWYDSIRVIRQPAPGAWAPVLSSVFGRRLRGFLSKRGCGENV